MIESQSSASGMGPERPSGAPSAAARRCPVCGRSLEGEAKSRVYCSSACRSRAKQHRDEYPATSAQTAQDWGEATCPVCGVPFRRRTSTQVFCSPACRRAARRVPTRWRHDEVFPHARPAHEFTCAYCGALVRCEPGDPRVRFCSRDCERAFWRHGRAKHA